MTLRNSHRRDVPQRSRPATVGNITFFQFKKICSACNNRRMGTPEAEAGGLRERKKRATRHAYLMADSEDKAAGGGLHAASVSRRGPTPSPPGRRWPASQVR